MVVADVITFTFPYPRLSIMFEEPIPHDAVRLPRGEGVGSRQPGGFIGRYLLSAVCLLALGSVEHPPLRAQGWDDRTPNVLTAGFGGNSGGLGVNYRRQLPSVPVSLGAGFGILGPALHVDLTLPALASATVWCGGGRYGRLCALSPEPTSMRP